MYDAEATEDFANLVADVKDAAHNMLNGLDNYGQVIDTTQGTWAVVGYNEHGPMTTVMLTLLLPAGREVDHIMVVGFAIPHDGNLTVIVNHMDGILKYAEEMFG